jgi:hypothetical protein
MEIIQNLPVVMFALYEFTMCHWFARVQWWFYGMQVLLQ